MDKLQRAKGQPEFTIIWENILRMSIDYDIPLAVITESGQQYYGMLKDMLTIGSYNYWYIRRLITSKEREDDSDLLMEQHYLIRIDRIEGIFFDTDSGLLDDLIP